MLNLFQHNPVGFFIEAVNLTKTQKINKRMQDFPNATAQRRQTFWVRLYKSNDTTPTPIASNRRLLLNGPRISLGEI